MVVAALLLDGVETNQPQGLLLGLYITGIVILIGVVFLTLVLPALRAAKKEKLDERYAVPNEPLYSADVRR